MCNLVLVISVDANPTTRIPNSSPLHVTKNDHGNIYHMQHCLGHTPQAPEGREGQIKQARRAANKKSEPGGPQDL